MLRFFHEIHMHIQIHMTQLQTHEITQINMAAVEIPKK